LGRTLLRGATLLDPDLAAPGPGSLLLAEGRIEARLAPGEPGPADAERVDLGGRGLAPGFLDLHYHGSLIVSDASGYGASLAASSELLLRHGTTAFLVTSVAWSRDRLREALPRLVELLGGVRWPGAVPIGLHLEGPWINARAAGAQPGSGIRSYDAAEGAETFARASGALRMVTLAPEVPGALALTGELTRRGVIASLGHSLATAPEIEVGLAAGLRHVTHLFNAMGPLHHRDLGVAGFALADDRLSCDLICDGAHVHPAMVRLAARAKGDRLLFITDRIELEGAGRSFGSGELRDDGVAVRLPDGRLAGSCLTLDRAIRNVIGYGAMTQLDAVRACTLRPARLLGIERERGTLRPGARADLVLLDAEGLVAETWLEGRRAFSRS
jgi:N-acetylglucosamine-6-phosphate deacetylase